MENNLKQVSRKPVVRVCESLKTDDSVSLSTAADSIHAAVSAEACDMIMYTAFTHSANLPFLFETAVELMYTADKPMRSSDFYEGLGALFGKSGAATRRCMNYSRFEYERCREEIESLQNVSEKAFGYMQAEDIIRLFCEEIKRRNNGSKA